MSLAAIQDETARLIGLFKNAGAEPIGADILQPAETLLDIYGEDIRARAYVTSDPLRGEMMLRPDFTVPIVQAHMAGGVDPARYCYAGKVFRKQELDAARPIEFEQVGYEVFASASPAEADAEVFALISEALAGLPVRASTGDLGILTAAVRGLQTSEARKAALLRHLWRPKRFLSLLARFCGEGEMSAERKRLLEAEDPFVNVGEAVGVRSRKEVIDRLVRLREEASTPPISHGEREMIDALLGLKQTSKDALSHLRDIAVDLPAIASAVDRFAQRLEALAERGVDVDALQFEGSYGRTTLEYYDGFVFGFYAGDADAPVLATGGRYDALTAVLGKGRAIPAVGGVIRPAEVAALREAAR